LPTIVGFELAGDKLKAAAILDAWGEAGTLAAAFDLGFDYLFIFGYSTLMTLFCLWASTRYSNRALVSLGVSLAWLQWMACFLDCIEDAAYFPFCFMERRTGRLK